MSADRYLVQRGYWIVQLVVIATRYQVTMYSIPYAVSALHIIFHTTEVLNRSGSFHIRCIHSRHCSSSILQSGNFVCGCDSGVSFQDCFCEHDRRNSKTLSDIAHSLSSLRLNEGETYARVRFIARVNQSENDIAEGFNQKSGWYFGSLSWKEADQKLKLSEDGTFLLRDSSSSSFRYALSFQTNRGPTSVRILKTSTGFSLDGSAKNPLLRFPTLHDLASFYINQQKDDNSEHIWLDSSGSFVSPVKLSKPYREKVVSLKHLCRLVVNRQPKSVNESKLPGCLRKYLLEYPFSF